MKTIYSLLFTVVVLFFTGCKPEEVIQERNDLQLSAPEGLIVLDGEDESATAVTFNWTAATPVGADYSFTYLFQLDIANNDFKTAISPITIAENVNSVTFTAGQLYDYIIESWGQVAGEVAMVDARIVAKVDGPIFMYPEIATATIAVQTYVPESNPLYLLGTATTAGLNYDNAILMKETSNGRIYTWSGELKKGKFKFIEELGQEVPSLNRGEQDSLLVRRESLEEADNQFEIYQDGSYSIWVSKKEMKIKTNLMTYQALYIVGDGAGTAWEHDKGVKMEPDPLQPTVFKARVTLTADGDGEDSFKILTENNTWNCPTFRPTGNNGSITSTQVILTSSGDDYKWKVTEDQNGTYDVILNTDPENLKIEFIKL